MKEKSTLLKALKAFTVALSEGKEVTEAVKVELATMKLEDEVTVLEAEAFEAGQPVMILTEDEQRIALPVNEEGYVLSDGMVLIVKEEGVIFSIEEKATEEEAPVDAEAPATEEVAQADTQTAAPVAKKIIEAITKEHHFSTEEVDSLKSELEAVKLELSKLKEEEATPAEGEIKHNPEAKTEEINLSKVGKESMMEFLNRTV